MFHECISHPSAGIQGMKKELQEFGAQSGIESLGIWNLENERFQIRRTLGASGFFEATSIDSAKGESISLGLWLSMLFYQCRVDAIFVFR